MALCVRVSHDSMLANLLGLAFGAKTFVILITVFVVIENALTPRFSKSHSLAVFSVMIFEMLLFQTQIRL
jgi:hypothetical protein